MGQESSHLQQTENMEKPSVHVTLRSYGSNTTSYDRNFVLNDVQKAINIGRASENGSRSAQVNNCYFDSPILSRKHAQFVFGDKTNPLKIVDTGSTHGTRVGTSDLKSGALRTLKNNSIITLGRVVANGASTFNPAMFMVSFEYRDPPQIRPPVLARSIVIRAPSVSDDSEVEEAILSVVNNRRGQSQEIREPSIVTTHTTKVTNPVIDLTEDSLPIAVVEANTTGPQIADQHGNTEHHEVVDLDEDQELSVVKESILDKTTGIFQFQYAESDLDAELETTSPSNPAVEDLEYLYDVSEQPGGNVLLESSDESSNDDDDDDEEDEEEEEQDDPRTLPVYEDQDLDELEDKSDRDSELDDSGSELGSELNAQLHTPHIDISSDSDEDEDDDWPGLPLVSLFQRSSQPKGQITLPFDTAQPQTHNAVHKEPDHDDFDAEQFSKDNRTSNNHGPLMDFDDHAEVEENQTATNITSGNKTSQTVQDNRDEHGEHEYSSETSYHSTDEPEEAEIEADMLDNHSPEYTPQSPKYHAHGDDGWDSPSAEHGSVLSGFLAEHTNILGSSVVPDHYSSKKFWKSLSRSPPPEHVIEYPFLPEHDSSDGPSGFVTEAAAPSLQALSKPQQIPIQPSSSDDRAAELKRTSLLQRTQDYALEQRRRHQSAFAAAYGYRLPQATSNYAQSWKLMPLGASVHHPAPEMQISHILSPVSAPVIEKERRPFGLAPSSSINQNDVHAAEQPSNTVTTTQTRPDDALNHTAATQASSSEPFKSLKRKFDSADDEDSIQAQDGSRSPAIVGEDVSALTSINTSKDAEITDPIDVSEDVVERGPPPSKRVKIETSLNRERSFKSLFSHCLAGAAGAVGTLGVAALLIATTPASIEQAQLFSNL